MAFGGVATGNIKAQLAAKQTGIANETGKTPIAIPPKTGRNVVVVVTLLVISVKNIIKVAIAKIKNIGGIVLNTIKLSPIQIPKPLELICDASDRPPPKRIKRPQGKSFDFSHSNKSPLLLAEGVIKISIAAIIATPASVRPDKNSILLSRVLKTQAKTAKPNIIDILISSLVRLPILFSIF